MRTLQEPLAVYSEAVMPDWRSGRSDYLGIGSPDVMSMSIYQRWATVLYGSRPYPLL